MSLPAAILDVDGTLVDSNYHHAIAWYRAFRQHDLVLPIWRIHRSIGMGGDQLVAHLAGEDWDAEHGDEVRSAEKALYMALIEEVEPLPDAKVLLRRLLRRGHRVVLASSAKGDEIEHYVDLLEVREDVEWTSSADVEQTKPEPDVVRAALEKAGTDEAVMLGDTIWDVEAAARAGIPCVALLTGGFGTDELLTAGAAGVVQDLTELVERIDETPFAGRNSRFTPRERQGVAS